jgi:non-specific serine/threonine protein kinase/serine/threonine-protein kinase
LKQVVEYLAKDVFSGTAPGKKGKKSGRSVTVGELLDQAEATVGERFRGQPLVEANVRMALAESYRTLWESTGRAERSAARAAQIRERHLGPEHPATLEALSLQAFILCITAWDHTDADALHKNRAAERIARRVLDASIRVLGTTHADTLLIQTRLAHTVSNLGRQDEAEALAAEALAAEAEALAHRFLGLEHDVTLTVQHDLGLIAERHGNLARAEALDRHVLEANERIHGALDPAALYALERLTAVVRRQGRAVEARQLHLDTVNRFAQSYGLWHNATGQMIVYLFSLLEEQGDYVAIHDLCEGWIREILAMPPELDNYYAGK